MTDECPRIEALSTYLDAQLDAAACARLDAHLATCVRCRALLDDLCGLRTDLRALADERLGFDLSQVVRGRIATLPARAPQRRTPRWRRWLPAGVGAAASLTLGLTMGLSMTAPVAAVAPVAATLEVFAPIAPGGLCIGMPACWRTDAWTGVRSR